MSLSAEPRCLEKLNANTPARELKHRHYLIPQNTHLVHTIHRASLNLVWNNTVFGPLICNAGRCHVWSSQSWAMVFVVNRKNSSARRVTPMDHEWLGPFQVGTSVNVFRAARLERAQCAENKVAGKTVPRAKTSVGSTPKGQHVLM